MKSVSLIIIASLLLAVGCSRSANRQNNHTPSHPKTDNEEKFGLTKLARIVIFKEIYKLHSDVRPIVDEKYPVRDRNLVFRNYELYRALLKKRNALEDAIIAEPQKKLATEYGIPVEELESIYQE